LNCGAFTPVTVTPGTTPGNSATFTVTASANAFLPLPHALRPTPTWSPIYLLWAALLIVSSVALWLTALKGAPRRRLLCRYAALATVALSLALALAGCGGGGGGGGGGGVKAARVYNFTVTGTSGASVHSSATVTLTVQ
jgi:hypothetical protein